MPVRPVVLNNTPLVALWAIGRLDLLRQLFGEILIPEAVREEFLARDAGERSRSLEAAPWIRTVALAHPRRVLSLTGLDRGEAEVLVLAEEQEARLVILDEKKLVVMRNGWAFPGPVPSGSFFWPRREGSSIRYATQWIVSAKPVCTWGPISFKEPWRSRERVPKALPRKAASP